MERITSFWSSCTDLLSNMYNREKSDNKGNNKYSTLIKDNKIVIISIAVGLIVIGYIYYEKEAKEEALPMKVKPGTKFIDYPENIQSNKFIALKYLTRYPLIYTLPNGNKICYNEYGDKNGFTILHFHGSGGCNFEALIYQKYAKKYGFHIISVDRPGHGYSSLKSDKDYYKYTFKQYSNDISLFLTHCLKIEKKLSIGLSGSSQGGLYAIPMLNFLKNKHNFNIKICFVFAGLPLTDMTLLSKNKLSDEYKKVIPKATQNQWSNYINHPWITKIFIKLFIWYMKKENNKNDKQNNLNYNWAIEFFRNQRLLNENDIIAINEINSETNDGIKLNGMWFSKEMGKYSLLFSDVLGETLSVFIQQKKGFEFNEINKDIPIFWFHGTDDRLIPIEWIKVYHNELVQQNGLSNLKRIEYNNVGHFSIFGSECVDKVYSYVKNKLIELEI